MKKNPHEDCAGVGVRVSVIVACSVVVDVGIRVTGVRTLGGGVVV